MNDTEPIDYVADFLWPSEVNCFRLALVFDFLHLYKISLGIQEKIIHTSSRTI